MSSWWHSKAKAYLSGTLGLEAEFTHPPEWDNLPLQLTQPYEAALCKLLDSKFLSLFSQDEEFGPSVIEKHADWLRNRTGMRSLFVFESLDPYTRKRLIESRIPFLCLDKQLYLPDLGLDLRENLRPRQRKTAKLSPAAQALVLAYLHRRIGNAEDFTGAAAGRQFGYTKMTMARAIDELRQHGLVETRGDRRFASHRFLRAGRDLWDKAQPLLRSPVTKRLYLEEWISEEGLLAGESALSELTYLGSPRRQTRALTQKRWKALQNRPGTHLVPDGARDSAHAELEIWRYDPELLSGTATVDTLSLALSLRDEQDERVQMAVEETLHKFSW